MSRISVCIDFDGVVHQYSSPFEINAIRDPPVPGAFDAIRRFQEDGWQVDIFSSRSDGPAGIALMRDWFTKWGNVEHEQIGCGIGWMLDINFPLKKPAAFISIDDRAFQFDGKWGLFVPKELRLFRPWNKLQ